LVLTLWLLAGPSAASTEHESPIEQRVGQLEEGLGALREDVTALRALLETLTAGSTEEEATRQIDARIDSIEAATEGLSAEQAKLSSAVEDTTSTLDSMSEDERRRTNLTVYGTFNAIDAQGENSVFDAEAFELVLSGRPHDRLGFFAEIEFERAAGVGGRRGGEVVLEQAYASFSLAKWLNLRAGVLLVPFGNFNVDHFAPNRDVISKPLVSFVIAPSDWTDNGFGIEGGSLLGDIWSFDYETYLVSGLDSNITGVGTRAARQAFGQDNNNNKAIVGRFAWHRLDQFGIGLSGYSGAYDDLGALQLDGLAIDSLLHLGRVKLTGEYNHLTAEQQVGRDAVLKGYYVRFVLDITPGALRRGRAGALFPTARVELVGQYDSARLEGPVDGIFEHNRERRLTLGINYRPSRQWVLKLDYEDSEATHRTLQRGNFQGLLGSIGFQF